MGELIEDRFSGLVKTYTTFSLIRIAILFIVIAGISESRNKILRVSKENIDIMNAVKHVLHIRCEQAAEYDDDYWLKKAVSEDDNSNYSNLFYTSKLNESGERDIIRSMFYKRFPTIKFDSLGYFLPDSIKTYFQNYTNSCLEKVENVSKDSFTIKLVIFSDITFDLRFWIFIIPFLFSFVALYTLTLHYKIKYIQIAFLGAKTNNERANVEYPYLYLKRLFNFINLVFGIYFCYEVYQFKNTYILPFRINILMIYFLLFYFSLAYNISIQKKILGNYFSELKGPNYHINKIWLSFSDFVRRLIFKIGHKKLFSSGVLFLFLTLFLSMSYDACKETSTKGYELLVEKDFWTGKDWNRHIYINDYRLLFLFAPIACVFLFFKKIKKISPFVIRFLFFYFSISSIIYGAYIALAYIMSYFGFGDYLAGILILLWITIVVEEIFKFEKLELGNSARLLLLINTPLCILSLITIVPVVIYEAGIVPCYISICLFTTACYLFLRSHNT